MWEEESCVVWKEKYRGEEECARLELQVGAGYLALIAGVIQMITCMLAIGTKIVNWVAWIVFHLIALLFSAIGAILVFTAFAYYYRFWVDWYWCKVIQAQCQRTAHYSTSMTDAKSINSVVTLFGVMLIMDGIFCITGIYFMYRNRKDTIEADSVISEAKAEDSVPIAKEANEPEPSTFPASNNVKSKLLKGTIGISASKAFLPPVDQPESEIS
jgi:hypothetical protein